MVPSEIKSLGHPPAREAKRVEREKEKERLRAERVAARTAKKAERHGPDGLPSDDLKG